jgi:hypothetical protein
VTVVSVMVVIVNHLIITVATVRVLDVTVSILWTLTWRLCVATVCCDQLLRLMRLLRVATVSVIVVTVSILWTLTLRLYVVTVSVMVVIVKIM